MRSGLVGGAVIGGVIASPTVIGTPVGLLLGNHIGAPYCFTAVWTGRTTVDNQKKPHTLLVALMPSDQIPAACEKALLKCQKEEMVTRKDGLSCLLSAHCANCPCYQ